MLFPGFCQGTHYDMDAYAKKRKDNDWSSSGDVKYHLGTSMTRTYPDGRTVHLSLLANPSHLEVSLRGHHHHHHHHVELYRGTSSTIWARP
jgi:hypothetical protein